MFCQATLICIPTGHVCICLFLPQVFFDSKCRQSSCLLSSEVIDVILLLLFMYLWLLVRLWSFSHMYWSFVVLLSFACVLCPGFFFGVCPFFLIDLHELTVLLDILLLCHMVIWTEKVLLRFKVKLCFYFLLFVSRYFIEVGKF